MEQNKKLKIIISTIEEEASQRENEILKEAENQVAAELKKAEEKAKIEAELFEKQQNDKINENASRKVTAGAISARRAIFKRRMEIMEEVFESSAEKISAFTKTDKYIELLLNSAHKINDLMHGKCSMIYLREDDLPFAARITPYLGKSIAVLTDNTIKLGGIKAVASDGKIMIDDTLDTRLDAQKNWFMKNSRLDIS